MNATLRSVPDLATGSIKLAGAITDKDGFAARWLFSRRHVDTLLAQGLPHLKVGTRRVRILTAEGDAWMKEKFGTSRRGRAKKSETSNSTTVESQP